MSKRPLPIVQELQSLLKTSPFVGLVIRTSDGESFHVSHPDYVLVAPNGQMVHCYDDDQHPHHLNARQIVSITPARTKSKKSAKESKD